MSDLPKRLASGLVLGIVFAISAWLGGFVFIALLCAASCVIWFEWCGIRMPHLDDRLLLAGALTIIAMALVLWLASGWWFWALLLIPPAFFCISAIKLGQTASIKGLLYAAILMVSLGHLRGVGDNWAGFISICFLCAVVFATDIGAYFVGRSLGGPKLWPAISPNKTISGAAGGLFIAMIAATLTYVAFGLSPVWIAACLAALLSVVAQCGDLYESWIKRRAGVKDSGRLIPGHGGVMDRVDGLLFAAFGLWLSSVVAGHWLIPANTFFAVG
ncbi:MAG: phosphatidate cytidylyltransferase [Pseudomonadota bacterium]